MACFNTPGSWDFMISYTQRNAKAELIAAELYSALSERGRSVWLDVKMKQLNEAAMNEAAQTSRCILAIVSGVERAGDPEENAYFKRPLCCKELCWALEAGVPVQPIIHADDKKRIGEFLALAPPDLQHLAGVDFIHLDRSRPAYWQVGVDEVIKGADSLASQAAAAAILRPYSSAPILRDAANEIDELASRSSNNREMYYSVGATFIEPEPEPEPESIHGAIDEARRVVAAERTRQLNGMLDLEPEPEPETEPMAWQCQFDRSRWVPYSEDAQQALTLAYSRRGLTQEPQRVSITLPASPRHPRPKTEDYEFDFHSMPMVQRNLITRTERQIRLFDVEGVVHRQPEPEPEPEPVAGGAGGGGAVVDERLSSRSPHYDEAAALATALAVSATDEPECFQCFSSDAVKRQLERHMKDSLGKCTEGTVPPELLRTLRLQLYDHPFLLDDDDVEQVIKYYSYCVPTPEPPEQTEDHKSILVVVTTDAFQNDKDVREENWNGKPNGLGLIGKLDPGTCVTELDRREPDNGKVEVRVERRGRAARALGAEHAALRLSLRTAKGRVQLAPLPPWWYAPAAPEPGVGNARWLRLLERERARLIEDSDAEESYSSITCTTPQPVDDDGGESGGLDDTGRPRAVVSVAWETTGALPLDFEVQWGWPVEGKWFTAKPRWASISREEVPAQRVLHELAIWKRGASDGAAGRPDQWGAKIAVGRILRPRNPSEADSLPWDGYKVVTRVRALGPAGWQAWSRTSPGVEPAIPCGGEDRFAVEKIPKFLSGTVRKNYKPSYKKAIPVTQGDVVTLLDTKYPDWLKVRSESSGTEGFVPRSFIELSSADEPFATPAPWLVPVQPRLFTHSEREEQKMPLRILCIDGGGIKGLVPAVVLQRLEEICDRRRVHSLFDLVCGTSTGGIIALGTCVADNRTEDMIDVYKNQAGKIWQTKRSGWSPLGLAEYYVGLTTDGGGKYDAAGLEKILQEKTKHNDGTPMRLDDATVQSGYPRVFVTAHKINTEAAAAERVSRHIFSSYPRKGDSRSNTCEVWEAGRATGAAPTFLDPMEIDGVKYVDGGLTTNNPTELAITEAERLFPGRQIGCIVSLGCGLERKREDVSAGAKGPINVLLHSSDNSERVHREVLSCCESAGGGDSSKADTLHAYGVYAGQNGFDPKQATGLLRNSANGFGLADNFVYARFNPKVCSYIIVSLHHIDMLKYARI
jgi:predicted acylesterase/phospholipase RssA